VHLVGFIIRIYHETCSPECQTKEMYAQHNSKTCLDLCIISGVGGGDVQMYNSVQQWNKAEALFRPLCCDCLPISGVTNSSVKLSSDIQFILYCFSINCIKESAVYKLLTLHKQTIMHGHDRCNTTMLSITHNMSTTCFGRCESQLPLQLAAITTPQYEPPSPSSL